MNNNLLLQAQKWLAELGIKSEADQSALKINRNDVYELDMFNIGSDVDGPTFIGELKTAVSTKLYLAGKDDNFIYLESF